MEGALEDPDREDRADPAAEPENLRATLAAVAGSDAPFQLGDFEIDDEGRLRPRPDGTPISFGFSYRGVDFMAAVETGPAPRVSLSAELGKLPFRAEVGERRQTARRIVDATQALPRGGISLSESHDMHLSAEMAAPTPLTPSAVMVALTAILLDFKPYLDLLHEVLIAPPSPAPDASAP